MRYFLGLLAFVAFIILVVVVVTHGGGSKTTSPVNGAKVVQLTDYIDKNSEVRVYADGPITGPEDHGALEIDVTAKSRVFTIYKGYNRDVLTQKTYTNDPAAYDNFLRSLNLLNFIHARKGVTQTDERGICAEGYRFIYELLEDNKAVTRLWSTSCGSSQGTFAGQAETVQDLFQKQIPDYDRIISSIR